MSIPALLHEATLQGVSISLHDDRLKLSAAQQPPSALIDDIREHRDAIVARLSGRSAPGSFPARITAAGGKSWLEPRMRKPMRKSCQLPPGSCPKFAEELQAAGWHVLPPSQFTDNQSEHIDD